jgi:hypothetical protein
MAGKSAMTEIAIARIELSEPIAPIKKFVRFPIMSDRPRSAAAFVPIGVSIEKIEIAIATYKAIGRHPIAKLFETKQVTMTSQYFCTTTPYRRRA